MDRRAKKLDKKRKNRELAKKKANELAARKPSARELLLRAAARGEFGPCYVSAGWEDTSTPALVSLIVTRQLRSGDLHMSYMLVDRTCLGIKDVLTRGPMSFSELGEFVEDVGAATGGMLRCDPLVAQSLIFHAIDYARTLGFEPHPDYPAALIGERPAELLSTPWCTPARPVYVEGGREDNAPAIIGGLSQDVGPDGLRFSTPRGSNATKADDKVELVYSPLQCTIVRDGVTLQIFIYRGPDDTEWILEVEDQEGGSTVWDGTFASDQDAFDAAQREIDESGAASFLT
jgi:hypothetical protein